MEPKETAERQALYELADDMGGQLAEIKVRLDEMLDARQGGRREHMAVALRSAALARTKIQEAMFWLADAMDQSVT